MGPCRKTSDSPFDGRSDSFLMMLQVIRRKAAMSAGAQAAPSAELPSSSTSTPQGEHMLLHCIYWVRASRAVGGWTSWAEACCPLESAIPGPAQTLFLRRLTGAAGFLFAAQAEQSWGARICCCLNWDTPRTAGVQEHSLRASASQLWGLRFAVYPDSILEEV